MVEGRHFARVDASVWLHAVPSFPNGSGAHAHRIQPRRALFLQEHGVGRSQVAGGSQSFGDKRSSGKTRADFESILFHNRRQTLSSVLHSLRSLVEAETNDKSVCGSRITQQSARALNVCVVEVRFASCGHGSVLFLVSRRHLGTDLGHVAKHSVQKRICHEIGQGQGSERIFWRRFGIQPVAKSVRHFVLVPANLSGNFWDALDPLFHTLVSVSQDECSPDQVVQFFGQENCAVLPDGTDSVVPEMLHVLDHIGHSNRRRIRELGVCLEFSLAPEIFQPAAEHGRTVKEERGRSAEKRNVASPAHSLVSLRAVCGQSDEVASCASNHIVVQSVEKVVVTGKLAGSRHVGRDHHRTQILKRKCFRNIFHLAVAEAVESKAWSIQLARFFSLECVCVCSFGLAQRSGAQLSMLHNFSMLESDSVAFWSRGVLELNKPDNVLAKINHGFSLGRGEDSLWRDLSLHSDVGESSGLDARRFEWNNVHSGPAAQAIFRRQ
ncbi:hypothetical protein CLUG_02924 [Clavispora lusitaniae ATCC 42720]|uniref:Uncharacterized protein n=1 Tax=Clavispora lusitaniae (strain ATCC 42720) TaxID=306902 RepID=C4Y311_CLAL4|nr:uncharacterized protein CLUG_02924 [Clavispora lusitaniae ATCC 42720]EEQ38797.1 hypothetical protein CLUG_02924 [Clavispora lusitaniae ATCC 42720]